MDELSRPFPLSFAQQRLWLLDKLAPGIPFYNIPAAIRLRGKLDARAFTGALSEIVRRHESLRTIFGEDNGQPAQFITPPQPFDMPRVDLRGLDAPAQERELMRLVAEESARPFDLVRGPLFRGALYILEEQDHVAMVSMHHIVSDGWSAGILTRELMDLYSAFSSGRPSSLPELPIQYVDFAVWQRELLQGEVLERELAYWREQLAHLPPVLSLPTDRPRPSVQGFRGSHRRFTVPAPVSARLKALTREKGATLFSLFLTAFKVLLYRASGQWDIPVGFPVANRSRVEIEGLIGFFVNTLVLRSDLSGNPGFSALVEKVTRSSIEAFSHQDVPFERLVEELQPERNLSHTPLFQVVFSFQNSDPQTLTLPGLTLEGLALPNKTSKFDLSLIMMESGGNQLGGSFEYSTELFDDTTIERMIGHLQNLFSQVAADPGIPIGALDLASEAERHQLLIEWNDTRAAYEQQKLLHEQLEEHAALRPDAVAVVSSAGRWTYGELNRRANQVARHLRSLGVGPDVPVALYLERAFEQVVALAGILKAGGAYLGLDLSSPQERLRYVLEDSRAPVVLTQERMLPKLPETRAQRLCLDRDWPLFEGYGGEDLPRLTGPDHMHSVIYTSGSTGEPKGTLTTIRGYQNLCSWYAAFSRHSPATRSLLATGLNFDASFRSIFSALLRGGCTVLADNGPYDAEALLATIRDHQVTVITCPPSLMHAVIDLAAVSDYADLSSLRYLHLGGEAVVNAKLRGWVHSENCHCTITNVYGLTETSDVSAAEVARVEDFDEKETISIGRPLQNHHIYVLNPAGRMQPIGVPGEICIGGDGCARGFLNRPDLTAERFAPDPFVPGERVYRTGDLARWLPDGRLEYAGRVDHQVKVRGFRIELGEIESVVAQSPGVREAVVMAREVTNEDKRLVAYLLTQPGESPASGEVRAFVRSRLPEFMVPTAFVFLDAFPLNASGKIDRQRLPEPEWGREKLSNDYAGPRTPEEEKLAAICAELLKVERVGVEDNFFELGGHSLLAMQLLARVRDQFHVQVPLRRLFQAPTVAGMAAIVLELSQAGKAAAEPVIGRVSREASLLDSLIVKIQPAGSRTPIFCVHPANGTVRYYFELAKSLGAEQPFYGLQAPDPDELPSPPERLEDLAALYLQAVRRVQAEGPYLLAGWSTGGVVALEMAQQLQAAGQACRLALLDPTIPQEGAAEDVEDNYVALHLFTRDLGDLGGKSFAIPKGELEVLDPEEQLNYVVLKARIHKVLPPNSDTSQISQLFRIFKMSLRTTLGYTPRPWPNAATLILPQSGAPERRQRWSRWLTGPLEVVEVPGNHYDFLQAPHVETLARALERAFQQNRKGSPMEDVFDLGLFKAAGIAGGLTIGMPANVAAHTRELCGGVYLALEKREENANGASAAALRPVWMDDQRDAATAQKVAQEFARMGVRAVIGHLSASAALPAAEVYHRERILFLAPGTSHPDLTEQGFDTTFRVCGRDDRQGEELVRWAQSNRAWEKVALVEQDIVYGRVLSRFIQQSWGEERPPLRRFTGSARGEMEAEACRELVAWQPDLILVAGIHELAAHVMRETRELGYTGDFLLSDDGLTPELLRLAGEAAEGAYVLSLYCPAGDPEVEQLIERYRQLTGTEVGAYFLTSYAATRILLDALEETGTDDPDRLAQVLREREWSTPLGALRFAKNGEVEGIHWHPWQVRDGKFLSFDEGEPF